VPVLNPEHFVMWIPVCSMGKGLAASTAALHPLTHIPVAFLKDTVICRSDAEAARPSWQTKSLLHIKQLLKLLINVEWQMKELMGMKTGVEWHWCWR